LLLSVVAACSPRCVEAWPVIKPRLNNKPDEKIKDLFIYHPHCLESSRDFISLSSPSPEHRESIHQGP